MEVKPTDVLLAFMQFLEILVPGALIAFLAKGWANEKLFCSWCFLSPIEDEAQRWVAFFLASYILGHFIFLVASFLDDWFYNPVRKKWKPTAKDLGFQRAREIKEEFVHDSRDAEIVNTFKWAKANLNLRFPGAMTEVRRYESDSKFFRSLVIALVIAAGAAIHNGYWRASAGCGILAVLSLWRYVDQRWKSTEAAYQYLIAIDVRDKLPPANEDKMPPAPNNLAERTT